MESGIEWSDSFSNTSFSSAVINLLCPLQLRISYASPTSTVSYLMMTMVPEQLQGPKVMEVRTKIPVGRWALVQCIPIKSPDNTMKTNVVCTLCHCSIGIYIGRVKVERFRKHFDQKQCIAADIPAKSVSQSIKKWTTPSLTSEQKEAYKLRPSL